MNKYIEVLGCNSTPRATKGALQVLGAIDSGLPEVDAKEVALSVAGAAAGAYYSKKHPVLGGLAGYAVGSNVVPLVRGYGNERKDAMYRMAIEGAAIGASYYAKKVHKVGNVGAVAAFAGGMFAATMLTLYMPGSPAHRLGARLERDRKRQQMKSVAA